MFQIALTKEERKLLADILEYDLKEARNEISNTENWEFKEELKKKENLIKKLLAAV